MDPLISVIVPVYNTEPYLHRCIESIIGQTYRELEIFLVDDGSSDGSGAICDEYAAADNRISAIHKPNGGLSCARNCALRIACGEYFSFVDSDDFIAKDFIEYLLGLMNEQKADIAACGAHRFSEPEPCYTLSPEKVQEFTSTDALRNMFYQRGLGHSAWGKLYRAKIFEGIEYPEGKIFEDVGTAYKLFWKANKVVYSAQERYFYFQRPGSITRSPFQLKRMDAVDFCDEILAFVGENCPGLERAAISYHISRDFQTLLKAPPGMDDRPEMRRISENIRKYRYTVLTDGNARLKNRAACLCSYLGLGLLRWMWKRYDAQ